MGRLYSSLHTVHGPSWRDVKAGTQAGTEVESMEECFLLDCSPTHAQFDFLYISGRSARDDTVHSVVGPSTSLIRSTGLPTGKSDRENVFN